MTDRVLHLGDDSIPRLLLSFSLPAIIGMLAQAAYNLVDRVYIGRALGPDGIAGITVSLPFMLILLACSMLVGFGAAALVSIRLGQQRKEDAERVLGNALLLLVLISLLVTAAGLWLLDPMLRVFGASDQVLPYGRDYLQVIVLGSVFQLCGFGMNAVVRGEGNPRTAMLTLLIGVTLNVLLAPLFIFVFGWGMRGAGLATVLSQAVSAVWVCSYFLVGRSRLKLRAVNLRPCWSVCGAMLAIGTPHFLTQLTSSFTNSLMNNQLRIHGGDLAISVMGIIYAVGMMFFMPIFGVNQGAQPIVGYNYGARAFQRVKRTWQLAVFASTLIALAGFVVMMCFPDYAIRLFGSGEERLLQLGARGMRLAAIMVPLVGFQVVSATYFQAVGKPKTAALLMLSRQVLFLIPAVLILPRFFGLDGVWLAFPAADFAASVAAGVCIAAELRSLDELQSQPESSERGCGSHSPAGTA